MRTLNPNASPDSVWEKIYAILDGEYQHFQNPSILQKLIEKGSDLPPHGISHRSFWLKREFESRFLIDDACQHFADTGKWPGGLDEKQLLRVMDRLLEARRFAEFACLGDGSEESVEFLPAPFASESKIIAFLLIRYWDWIGKERRLCYAMPS